MCFTKAIWRWLPLSINHDSTEGKERGQKIKLTQLYRSACPPCNSTAQCRLVDKSKSELCKSKASIASQDPLAAAMFKA